MEIKNIADFATAIANESSALVVIDFYADWCRPCRRIAPFYDTLSKKYGSLGERQPKSGGSPLSKVIFYKMNCNSLSSIAFLYKKKASASSARAMCKTYGVKSVPTFCFFYGGQYVSSVVGDSEQELEETLVKVLSQINEKSSL
jgi:thioredoxin 1